MKKLLIIILVMLYLWWLVPWFFCHGLKSPFHYSISQQNLTLDNLIHNDSNSPLMLIRFYHNKISIFATEFYTAYIQYWDIKFLINIISPIGIFGFFSSIWYFGKNTFRKWYFIILIFSMFSFPIVEIFLNPPIPFPLKITLLSLPIYFFSLMGIIKISEGQNSIKIYVFLIVLLWLSIWWHGVLPWESLNFCQ